MRDGFDLLIDILILKIKLINEMADPKVNKLSVYLMRRHVLVQDVLKKNIQMHKIEIPNSGILFVAESKINPPSWIKSFFPDAEIDYEKLKIFNSYPSAIFVVKINIENEEIIFAITFGGGWQMLEKDAIEENFGFRTILNLIDPKSLRSINKRNIALVQKNVRENIGRAGNIADFEIDTEQDLIESLTGVVKDRIFGTVATGKDSLHLSVDVNMSNVKERLVDYYKAYRSEEYKNSFSWIDKIKEIKNKNLILRLNEKILIAIKSDESDSKIWMAIPETIKWENVDGFKYGNKKETIYPDLYLADFKGIYAEENMDLNLIKRTNIFCVSSDGKNICAWKVFGCLYAEIEDEGGKYILNNGKWYLVDNDFFEIVSEDYASFPISNFFLPNCPSGTNEFKYNQLIAEREKLICFDGFNISYDGYNTVEFCDLYSPEKKIIHIKRYGNTNVLNNLFTQGVTAGRLFLSDQRFRKKVDMKISDIHKMPSYSEKIKSSEYEIIFGIISSSDKEFLEISFFSKIAIRSAKRMLETFGYSVSLKKILSEERGR